MAGLARENYDQDPNLVARVETNQGPVVVKWFGWRHPIHFYLSPLFRGRAWSSWLAARALEEAGARTPRPLFVYTRREKGFIYENLLVTSAIHPHRTLRALLLTDAPPQLQEKAVADLALSIAHMHAGGILHRDLTTGNFLVDDAGRVYLVDLNRARRLGHLSRRRRLKDLARISFDAREQTLKERLTSRFFKVYSTETDPAADWEGEYRRYRQRLLGRRHRKKRLLGLLRRK